MAKVYPTGDRIKVLPLLPQTKTKGGIVIPETARDRPIEGVVLAVGRGKLLASGILVPLEMEPGDVVQFGKHAGIYVRDAEIDLEVIIMRDEEVLARQRAAELPAVLPNDPRLVVSPPLMDTVDA